MPHMQLRPASRTTPSLPRLALRWACSVLLATGAAASAQDRLPAPVLQALADAKLPQESLAAAALPLGHDGKPWSVQGERPMVPASTMKVLTSIVALDRLGPNLRGFTELRTAAPREADGTLAGDLVLRGGGDPELSIAHFWAMLLELREQGVSRIAGNLVVDRHLWRPARLDVGLPPFDEAPEWPYNVIPDALHLAGALLPIELRADAEGRIVARSIPALSGLVFETSAMQSTASRCEDWDDEWKLPRIERRVAAPGQAVGDTVVVLQGGFPKGCIARAELQLIDRAELTERLFRTLWAQLGGRFDGRVIEAEQAVPLATSRVLVRRQSRPWGELLRPLNKISDNAFTRMLFQALGVPALATDPGATSTQLADRAVREWLRDKGIAERGLVTDNGSGLSRAERIAPLTLAEMLRANWQGPHRHDLLMSLPTVGVDGTMRNRLKASPAAGWARLKTGTLRNANALAGVVHDAEGRPWAVAMMVNDDRLAARGRTVLDALVDAMARGAPGRWVEGRAPAPVQSVDNVVGPQGMGP
jgi:D-alanyl-D-alanine carboxypeptidase/D-alanyl-D-alanine-endopeptidase (penicillin-binding protein 4)